ncbi:MAG: IS256 family transposase, partial [Firmicutes bacterium]|nr:IS256 family transposase [Bacillota bacterium]
MKVISLKMNQIKEFFSNLKENPSQIFQELREDVQSEITHYLNRLMEVEITLSLGRKPYERKADSKKEQGSRNYRNGKYERKFAIKGIGELTLNIPRDRNGEYQTSVLPRYKRHENEISQDVAMMYLGGLSTRSVSMISEKLLGCSVSSGSVSNINKELQGAIEQWRCRDLSDISVSYIYVDGVNFDMRVKNRVENSVEKVSVLVAIGMNESGHKMVLGFQSGDKESSTSWREFFRDLKKRGLRGNDVKLGIMDGLPGLEKVFEDEFPKADVQRCQVHIARNVLSKIPRAAQKYAADNLRDIFYASTKSKAMDYFEAFKKSWEICAPSAVRCLESSVEKALTYLNYDDSLWTSLRTTNPIERLNKEFKRRTKPMEIAGGEASLNNILGFISVKMEIGWKRKP